ncbi:MAG: hypothetical protein ACLTF5_10215 [Butyricicoccus sp.]
MDTVRGKFGLANTNKMLKSYQGLTGLKTGYIREAGFCISASAERDGLSLVAVVMAAPTRRTAQRTRPRCSITALPTSQRTCLRLTIWHPFR